MDVGAIAANYVELVSAERVEEMGRESSRC